MKTVHIVPHTHWDREWYMPFEWHRYRLVQLLDSLIALMENDPEYPYFHLDGQMIVLEDYLAIRPYMRERLFRLIRENRIQVGPWYVLQDEYLISDEANVRDMLIGLSMCREWGFEPVRTGYFPDSFGNISQVPQLLNGFGIQTAVFGRGGRDHAEINWRSEDGSQVAAVWLAGWYHNALELPVTEEACRQKLEKLCRRAWECSCLDDYLGMNGSDHVPVQTNLSEAIRLANRIGEGRVRFRHGSLKEYLQIVEKERDRYPVVQGELAGQDGNGKNLLIGTASARIYLKQWNHRVQTALERRAEPLSALAMLHGRPYEQDFLRFAWKKLLENHAHDSICGCSVDEVHRQMVSRFESAWQIADRIGQEALGYLARLADTSAVPGRPVTVWNTCAYPRTDIVEAVVDFPEEEPMGPLRLLDAAGREIPCTLCWEPHTFIYRLPDDGFRVVEYVNRCRVRFVAEDVPAMGCALYGLVPGAQSRFEPLPHTENCIENRWIRLSAARDGSLTLQDKETGLCLTGWNVYEDAADAGDEYMFASAGEPAVSTVGAPAEVELGAVTADEAVLVIRQTLTVPAGYDRSAGRVQEEKVPLNISTRVSLTRESRCVRVHTEVENTAENHRLRALFSHTVETYRVLAHGQFDLVERSIKTGSRWINPTNEQRMQAFVELRDDRQALVVAGQGLHEYEVSRNGHKTLELTLLRAVDILGDWGDFPTPEAQCLGRQTADYAVWIGGAGDHCRMEREALAYYAGEMPCAQAIPGHPGPVHTGEGLFSLEGDGLWSTAFKREEDGEDLVLRVYNLRAEPVSASLRTAPEIDGVYAANLAEERQGVNLLADGKAALDFRQKEIRTLILTHAPKADKADNE